MPIFQHSYVFDKSINLLHNIYKSILIWYNELNKELVIALFVLYNFRIEIETKINLNYLGEEYEEDF